MLTVSIAAKTCIGPPLHTATRLHIHLRLQRAACNGSPVCLQVNLTSGWRDLMPGFVRTQWLSWASVQTMTMDRERNLLYVAHVNGLLKVSVQGYVVGKKSRTSCPSAGLWWAIMLMCWCLLWHRQTHFLVCSSCRIFCSWSWLVGTVKGRSCGDNMVCGQAGQQ